MSASHKPLIPSHATAVDQPALTEGIPNTRQRPAQPGIPQTRDRAVEPFGSPPNPLDATFQLPVPNAVPRRRIWWAVAAVFVLGGVGGAILGAWLALR